LYVQAVPTLADAWRRWLGLLFLTLAFGLLVWGQTVLRDQLAPIPFVLYWGFCFLCTMGAIVTALLDVRATRKRAQREHEQLLRRTLEELERDSGNSPEQ
jgi:hypothetical protein